MAKNSVPIDDAAKLSKDLKQVGTAVRSIKKSLEGSFKSPLKDLGALNNAAKDLSQSIKNTAKQVAGLGVNAQTKKLVEDLEAIDAEVIKIRKDEKLKDSQKEKALNGQNKLYHKILNTVEEITDELEKQQKTSKKAAFGKMMDSFGIGGKRAEGVKKTGESFNKAGKSISEFSKVLSENPGKYGKFARMAGGLGKGLGGALEGAGGLLGKFAGPIGIGMMVGQAYNAIDKFVTSANKRFADVRGPDIETEDTKAQFKNFNDQIYSISENMKTGFDAAANTEFFAAFTQSGAHIANITKTASAVDDYRSSIDVAAKASRALGIDITAVGSMMGGLSNEYNMSLKEMDKAFTAVAFDAKRAGMSTNNFWDMVTGATTGLSFYGIELEKTSRFIEKLSEGGMTNAQIKSTATGITGAWANKSAMQNMPSAGVMVSEDFRSTSISMAKAAADALEKRIARTDISEKEKDTARAELERQRAYLADTGNAGKAAVAMGGWSGQENKVLAAMFSKYQPQKGGENQAQFTEIGKILGFGEDALNNFIRTVGDLDQTFMRVSKSGEKLKLGTDTGKFQKMYQTLANQGAPVADRQGAYKDFTEALKTSGMTAEDASDFVKFLQLVPKETAEAFIKKMTGQTLSVEDEKLIKDAEGTKYGKAFYGTSADLTPMPADRMARKTSKGILKSTMSLEEIVGIAGDSAKWAAMSALRLDGINSTARSILQLMPGSTASIEQRDASNMITGNFANVLGAKVKAQVDKSGVITNAVELGDDANRLLAEAQNTLLAVKGSGDEDKIAEAENKVDYYKGYAKQAALLQYQDEDKATDVVDKIIKEAKAPTFSTLNSPEAVAGMTMGGNAGYDFMNQLFGRHPNNIIPATTSQNIMPANTTTGTNANGTNTGGKADIKINVSIPDSEYDARTENILNGVMSRMGIGYFRR